MNTRAFPQQIDNTGTETVVIDGETVPPNTTWVDKGMTLRDYFAAKALSVVAGWQDVHIYGGGDDRWEDLATESYAIADAMLKARAA